jgi:hypothetical protein
LKGFSHSSVSFRNLGMMTRGVVDALPLLALRTK